MNKILLESTNVEVLNKELERSISNGTFHEVNDFLQNKAIGLARTKGFDVSPGRFAFQELVYLVEREKLDSSILNGRVSYDEIKSMISKSEGLKITMMVFEIFCDAGIRDDLRSVADIVHLCLERLIEKRDLKLLVEMLLVEYPLSHTRFWDLLSVNIADDLNPDFIFFRQNIKLVLGLLQYTSFDNILTNDQKAIILPTLIKTIGIDEVVANYAYFPIATSKLNLFSWLRETKLEGNTLNHVADIIVNNITDWDDLLAQSLSKKTVFALISLVLKKREELGESFALEVIDQLKDKI
jgi:hypothetical protein